MRKVNKLWPRLNYLVPEPQCSTWNDDYDSIVWMDIRKQPTIDELLVIDETILPGPKTHADWKDEYGRVKTVQEQVTIIAEFLRLE